MLLALTRLSFGLIISCSSAFRAYSCMFVTFFTRLILPLFMDGSSTVATVKINNIRLVTHDNGD
jgi:hypothetical protein